VASPLDGKGIVLVNVEGHGTASTEGVGASLGHIMAKEAMFVDRDIIVDGIDNVAARNMEPGEHGGLLEGTDKGVTLGSTWTRLMAQATRVWTRQKGLTLASA